MRRDIKIEFPKRIEKYFHRQSERTYLWIIWLYIINSMIHRMQMHANESTFFAANIKMLFLSCRYDSKQHSNEKKYETNPNSNRTYSSVGRYKGVRFVSDIVVRNFSEAKMETAGSKYVPHKYKGAIRTELSTRYFCWNTPSLQESRLVKQSLN